MTQTMFAPPPVIAAPEGAPETGGSSRRPLILVGGLVAALALAGGGYVLLSGGGSSDDLGSGPFVPPAAKSATKPVAKPAVKAPAAAKPAVKVPPTSTVPLGRDPFHALYLAPVATTATTTTAAPPTTTTTAPTTPTTTTTGTTTAPSTYKLTMTRVTGSGSGLTASFTVGGKLMAAKVGSVFGPTSEIKLLSLGQNTKGVWVATLQVGDSEPFDAAKGETLYVR